MPQHDKGCLCQVCGQIRLKEENLKEVLRAGTEQGCLRFQLLLRIVFVVLAATIIQKKKIKGIQIEKEAKEILFADFLYIKHPKDSNKAKQTTYS